ncbi:MAG: tetratricopeptide repeat protein [Spongiibacteraceae bacterium]
MPQLLIILLLSSSLLTACANHANIVPSDIDDATPAAKAKIATPPRAFPDDSFFELLVAEFALRNRDFEQALAHYVEQANKTEDTGVISTATKLARYLDKDQTAEQLAQTWLKLEPENAEASFILASSLSRNGRPLDALPHMTKVLQLGGDSNFAALAATAINTDKTEQDEFLRRINALSKQYPDETSIQIAQALMLQYRKEEDRALKLIRKVLTKDPKNAHALLIETRTLKQQGKDEEALTRLRYAVEQNPRNKRLRHDLARSLVKQDIYQAKAQYETLRQYFPADKDIVLELLLISRETDDTQTAEQLLNTLEQNPKQGSRAHLILGRLAEEEKKWPEAIVHFKSALSGDEFDYASRRLASIMYSIHGAEKALQTLAELRLVTPLRGRELYLLESNILLKENAYQRGYSLVTEALKHFADDEELLYSRSIFAEKLGDIDSAEHDLRTILKNEPDNAAALNALGYTLANISSRLDEAEELVRRALDLSPDDPATIDSYGWILLLRGNIPEAVIQLERAFAQSNDHEIAAHLGEALWKSGNHSRARAIWQQGLEETPNSPIILNTLRRLKLVNE